ncbi:hypothetical protein D4R51_03870 [bacterium]|nr:MAG: hypothetical protein D4R51_03870 [bacterium]
MPLPKKCKMPDLISLAKMKVLGSYLLSSLTGADDKLDFRFIQYRRVFVRLADKAIYEYQIAREAVIEQINDKDGGIYLAKIINHLENCINSVRRLLYLFDRIKSDRKNPFIIDRSLRRLIESKSSQIVDMRDIIEHIDTEILGGKIKNDQTIALDISDNASEIMIGGFNLSLTDLSSLITHFHSIASELAVFNAPGINPQTLKVIKQK